MIIKGSITITANVFLLHKPTKEPFKSHLMRHEKIILIKLEWVAQINSKLLILFTE